MELRASTPRAKDAPDVVRKTDPDFGVGSASGTTDTKRQCSVDNDRRRKAFR
jgi:hypothetical protein